MTQYVKYVKLAKYIKQFRLQDHITISKYKRSYEQPLIKGLTTLGDYLASTTEIIEN